MTSHNCRPDTVQVQLAPRSVPRGTGRATAVMEGQSAASHESGRFSPAPPGWQPGVTQWFFPLKVMSLQNLSSFCRDPKAQPTGGGGGGGKRPGNRPLSSISPGMAARGRQARESGRGDSGLQAPSLLPLLAPAPAEPFSPARWGGAGAGKSQGASVPETLVTHLEPQNVRLQGMAGRGPDLPKVTPWAGSPSTVPS